MDQALRIISNKLKGSDLVSDVKHAWVLSKIMDMSQCGRDSPCFEMTSVEEAEYPWKSGRSLWVSHELPHLDCHWVLNELMLL